MKLCTWILGWGLVLVPVDGANPEEAPLLQEQKAVLPQPLSCSLFYARQVLLTGLEARNRAYHEGVLEGDSESMASYQQDQQRAETQVGALMEAARRWQSSTLMLVDGYWRKELSARGYRDTRKQIAIALSDAVRKDALALARSACWYPEPKVKEWGYASFNIFAFEAPAGAPPFVQQLLRRQETHSSKVEVGAIQMAAQEYWRACLEQQVGIMKRSLFPEGELAELFAEAHAAWENYASLMRGLATEYCHCTGGFESGMAEMHSMAHYGLVLELILAMDCQPHGVSFL